MAACPPLEDIAAFIDGINLSPEERARITEHLAHCESCYEIFSGAVHFQEEERESSADDTGKGGVLPFPLAPTKSEENHVRTKPVRPARHASRWLALAASLLLVTTLGFMIWQYFHVLPEVTVASVAEPLQGKDGSVRALFQPNVDRGLPGAAPLIAIEAPAFLAGVYLVDLRLSFEAREVQMTRNLLGDVSGELEQIEHFVEPGTAAFFRERAAQITDDPATLAPLAQKLPQKERELQNELAEEPFLRFGLWAEGGRISATIKSPGFFEKRTNRRFLSAIPREIREISSVDERYAPLLEDLQEIEPLWDHDQHSAADYDALAQLFEKIIRRVEQIRKEDEDPQFLMEP